MATRRTRARDDDSAIAEYTVESPDKCLEVFNKTGDKGFIKGDFIKAGEYGQVFHLTPGQHNQAINSLLRPDGKYVLKIIKIPNEDAKRNFLSEIEIGKAIAEGGSAPRVYNYWFCITDEGTHGYYVMDLLSGVWDGKYDIHHKISKKPKEADINKLLGSEEHQAQLVESVKDSVARGYLHQDCHIGNIGFIKMEDGRDKAILFDFGLTVKLPEDCMDVLENEYIRNMLIASQLYIIIEQYQREVKFLPQNLIYQEIIGTIEEVPRVKSQVAISFAEQKQKIKQFIDEINEEYSSCCDVAKQAMLMTRLYQTIDSYPYPPDYYESTENEFPGLMYDLIYYIRLGGFKVGNFTYEALQRFFEEKGAGDVGAIKETATKKGKSKTKSSGGATRCKKKNSNRRRNTRRHKRMRN
jgi:hypothetical protein